MEQKIDLFAKIKFLVEFWNNLLVQFKFFIFNFPNSQQVRAHTK